jgi:hypothetical protein
MRVCGRSPHSSARNPSPPDPIFAPVFCVISLANITEARSKRTGSDERYARSLFSHKKTRSTFQEFKVPFSFLFTVVFSCFLCLKPLCSKACHTV